MSLSEACESLVEGIDARRTDIIKSILDHVRKTGVEGSSGLGEVVSLQCCEEGTLLHRAVSKENVDAARALLMAGSDPGIKNKDGVSVLDCSKLLQSPALNQVFTDELFRSIASSDLSRIQVLLAAGIQTSLVDSDITRNTAVHWAACFGSPDVMQLLIQHGAQVNVRNSIGATPLHDAVERGDAEIVKLILEAGCDVEAVLETGKKAGSTARDLAEGKEEILLLLNGGQKKTDVEKKINGLVEDVNEVFKNVNGAVQEVQEVNGVLNNVNGVPLDVNGVIEPHSGASHAVDAEKPVHEQTKPNLQPINSNGARREKPVGNRKFTLLWPKPKVVQKLGGEGVSLPRHLNLLVNSGVDISPHRILDTWELFTQDIDALGYTASVKAFSVEEPSSSTPGDIHLSINHTLDKDAYILVLSESRLKIVAGGVSGVQYAIATLIQILQLFRNEPIPAVCIRDKPQLRQRGILVDLAPYGRLPSVQTFIHLIRIVARLKLNQIYLYTRLSTNSDWQLLYSAEDIMSLDRESTDHLVDLVPTLDIVQPCSFSELSNYTPIFSRVISCFSSLKCINIGPCLSSVIFTAVRTLGSGAGVFSKLRSLLSVPSSAQLQLCSNSVVTGPAAGLLDQLPASLTLVDYGFQADYPFQANAATLARSGCCTLSCAGTAAWNCIVGRPATMVANIVQAVESIELCGGEGLIVANWTGSPALTHLSAALPGWVLGAGLSWNRQDADCSLLGEIIGHHVFQDETGCAGQLLLELGAAESSVVGSLPDSSQLQTSVLLCTVLRAGTADLEQVSTEQLGAVIQTTRRCLSKLQVCRGGVAEDGEAEGLLQEAVLGGELLLLSARLSRALLQTTGQEIAELSPTFKTDIANRLLALVEQYRAVWLSRYLPGGLQDTMLHLTKVLTALLPDSDLDHSFSKQHV